MAHLLGNSLPANASLALPLLHQAAKLSLSKHRSAYVYALLLLNEFTPASVPPHLFVSLNLVRDPSPDMLTAEAGVHLTMSASLHFTPTQYKLGRSYEFASPPFNTFDPLLSVEWYSRASQGGEKQADMALSKWFLCGSEGAFEKDENLARVFAERAATGSSKEPPLASALVEMGYYNEVGIGGDRDVQAAIKWYQRAVEAGNEDAVEKLTALTKSSRQPTIMGREEHAKITKHKLLGRGRRRRRDLMR